MNTPAIAVVMIAVVLLAGSTLSIMNNVSTASYQTWCAATSTAQHHYSAGCLITTADLR